MKKKKKQNTKDAIKQDDDGVKLFEAHREQKDSLSVTWVQKCVLVGPLISKRLAQLYMK